MAEMAEIEALVQRGRLLTLTPKCWKPGCWNHGCLFQCDNCKRSYHRACVLFGENFPEPTFDVTLDEALEDPEGSATLLNCSACLILEGQSQEVEKDLTDELKKLIIILEYIPEFSGLGDEYKKRTGEDLLGSIMENVNQGVYRTMDRFMIDIRQMHYDFICLFHEDSNKGRAMTEALDKFEISSMVLRSCIKCFSGIIGPDGGIVDKDQFRTVTRQLCETPHLLLWIKEPGWQFWPAKVFAVKDKCVYFISFGCNVMRKLKLGGKGVAMKEFTGISMRKEERTGSTGNQNRKNAIQDAKKYLEDWNAQPGVVPKVYDPEQEVNFDGNYEGAMERLY